jgi:poly [ADP-ribose] polymerase
MPAKKAAKVAKVAAKQAAESVSVSKSVSKSATKTTTKVTAKVTSKVDVKASKSSVKASQTLKASQSNDKKKVVSPPKADLSASKKSVSASKKDVSASKGKRDQPTKVDPPVTVDTKKAVNGIKKTESKEQIVKVITKGGAAVDSLIPNNSAYRVLVEGGKVYSATLNQANLDANNNKFYIIQVLVHETTGAITIWNRWGRVGVPGQNAMKGPFPKPQAIADFNSKYNDKAVKGDYREIEIKYDDG